MKKKKKASRPRPKPLNEWTKTDLLKLPHRKWDNVSPRYDSMLVMSTGKKHESGWGMMAIIGVIKNQPVEICTAHCDDIEWVLPTTHKTCLDHAFGWFRTDCAIRSGALHAWVMYGKFKVGRALSSTSIELCF